MDFEQEPAPEGTPVISVNIDSNKMVLHWFNTVLYDHAAESEEYDHVFVQTGENEGVYIWKQNIPNYDDLFEQLEENEFPYIFKPLPSEFDVEQYDLMMQRLAERADEYLEKWANGEE